MSFSNNSHQPEMNVTPLIDVLLVLIIIFMVLVPQKPDGLKALLPQPHHQTTPPLLDPTTIVVEVQSHVGGPPSYAMNQKPLAKEDIVARLTEIFAPRTERTMFVKGDADLEFRAIAEVVAMGHEARAENIGILTPKDQSPL